MSADLTWFKVTGLAAAQAAAHTVLALVGADAVNVLHLDYAQVAGVGAGAALVSFLTAVVAYKTPVQTVVLSTAAALVEESQVMMKPRHEAP